jgi:PilZ domain-containing protein
MEQLEQRKHARLGTAYLALFSGEKIRAQGVVLDLSVAGCRIRSAVEFTKGEFFGVVIDVPWYVNPLDVPLAVVRWSNGQECGMEFIQMEPDEQRRLRELV